MDDLAGCDCVLCGEHIEGAIITSLCAYLSGPNMPTGLNPVWLGPLCLSCAAAEALNGREIVKARKLKEGHILG